MANERLSRQGEAAAMRLSVIRCYGLAWRAFAKWWIPLCLISGVLFVFNILPQLLTHPEMSNVRATANDVLAAITHGDTLASADAAQRMRGHAYEFARQFAMYSLYFFPLVALLTVILLMCANWAVKDRREKQRSAAALVYITIVHTVLAAVKIAAFALLIVPGVYLYIKLVFVSLVMLEQKKGAGEAMAASWRMTRGNFWPLLLLIVMNVAVQIVASVTIIGLIPATGFANTARAAAFNMLMEAEELKKAPISA